MYRQPKYVLVPVAPKKSYRRLMEGPLMVFLVIVVAVAVGGVMLAIWYFSPKARAKRALRAAQQVRLGEPESLLNHDVKLFLEGVHDVDGHRRTSGHARLQTRASSPN